MYRRIPVDGKTEELAQWGVWCLFLGESASTLRVCSGMCIACASMHQMMTNVGGVGAWPQINQMSCAVGGVEDDMRFSVVFVIVVDCYHYSMLPLLR